MLVQAFHRCATPPHPLVDGPLSARPRPSPPGPGFSDLNRTTGGWAALVAASDRRMCSVSDAVRAVWHASSKRCFGLPCVGTAAWAVPEMVVDGETGFTIPVDDVDALTDRLVRLLSDSVLPRNMGRAGRLRAERYFTWPRVVERMTQAMTPGLQPELGKAWLGCFHILVASPATAA